MKKIKTNFFSFIAALAIAFAAAACSNDSSSPYIPPDSGPKITEAKITRIDENYEDILVPEKFGEIDANLIYPVSSIVGMRFVYPYKDPMGKDVMLSGIICVPKTIYKKEDKKAQGIMLYNHYTIMTNYECPSYGVVEGEGAIGLKEISAIGIKAGIPTIGATTLPIGLEDHKIITVAADYYGFGETSGALQYYCEGDYNARASLEALKAAKKLLKDLGYTWEDYLLNVGYSQGGQTAIAVQKLVDKGEYSENIAATYAGSGPYDLTATYNSYLDVKDQERDIAVVVYPVLSYNKFKSLGLDYAKTFKKKLSKKIGDWFLSKKYTREEIDKKIKAAGMPRLMDAFSEELLDTTSEASKKLSDALDTVKLTVGWTPKATDRIYLYYSEADTLVPPVNATEIKTFFTGKGFTPKEPDSASLTAIILKVLDGGDDSARPSAGQVAIRKSALADGITHESGGSIWMMDIISELKLHLNPSE